MIDLAQVEAHDTRIQAEVVEPWRFGVCDLCTYLECVADVHVCWRSAVDRRDHEAWVTGFLLSDLGDPDRYRDPVLVKIGGTT